ncbi:hypothetical protein IAT38_001435 [Cryptococcus sp. DSM 104549]
MYYNTWNLWYKIVVWLVVDFPLSCSGQTATVVSGFFSLGTAVLTVYYLCRWPPTLHGSELDPQFPVKGVPVVEKGEGEEGLGMEKDVDTVAAVVQVADKNQSEAGSRRLCRSM